MFEIRLPTEKFTWKLPFTRVNMAAANQDGHAPSTTPPAWQLKMPAWADKSDIKVHVTFRNRWVNVILILKSLIINVRSLRDGFWAQTKLQ